MDMFVEGLVESPQPVKERMLCHAIIGRQGGKEQIMKVDVTADFISPLLEFSTKAMYFRVDKVLIFTLYRESSSWRIRNQCYFPVNGIEDSWDTNKSSDIYVFRLKQFII